MSKYKAYPNKDGDPCGETEKVARAAVTWLLISMCLWDCFYVIYTLLLLFVVMGSKFFESFQVKADALKKSTTRWAEESEHPNRPISPLPASYMYDDAQPDEHNVGSDEDHARSPKVRFSSSNKVNSSSSSSVFANRPISALLRPTGQKETKVSTFKPGTIVIKPKTVEQNSPSQDLSAVLTRLSSMEGKIMSLIENKTASIEKKIDASEKRLYALETRTSSILKSVERVSASVHDQIMDGIKVSRGDLEHVLTLINDCTKESNNIVTSHIKQLGEEVANTISHLPSDTADEDFQIGGNEVVVIVTNSPYDTIHKASAEELMAIVGDNNIYVCSSIDELKRDLNMVREVDVTEAHDTVAEEA